MLWRLGERVGNCASIKSRRGEKCVAKHGRARRRRLKLHFGVDITSGEIAAHVLTDGHADDAA